MHDDKPSAAKKRRTTLAKEDEDDEEVVGVKKEAHLASGPPTLAPQIATPSDSAMSGRLVRLSFKATNSKKLLCWPVSASVLRKVPRYSVMLNKARSEARGKEVRLAINDDVARADEECMLQLFEYLADGHIEDINNSNTGTLSFSVARLISLCKLAKELRVEGLVEDVEIIIAKQNRLRIDHFFAIASKCCTNNSVLDVGPELRVGMWIRSYMRGHMELLDVASLVERITKQGGELAGILVSVLMETQRQRKVRSTPRG